MTATDIFVPPASPEEYDAWRPERIVVSQTEAISLLQSSAYSIKKCGKLVLHPYTSKPVIRLTDLLELSPNPAIHFREHPDWRPRPFGPHASAKHLRLNYGLTEERLTAGGYRTCGANYYTFEVTRPQEFQTSHEIALGFIAHAIAVEHPAEAELLLSYKKVLRLRRHQVALSRLSEAEESDWHAQALLIEAEAQSLDLLQYEPWFPKNLWVPKW